MAANKWKRKTFKSQLTSLNFFCHEKKRKVGGEADLKRVTFPASTSHAHSPKPLLI